MARVEDRRRRKLEQKREQLVKVKTALLTKMATLQSKAFKRQRSPDQMPAYGKLQSKIEKQNARIDEIDHLLKPYRDMEKSLGIEQSYVLREEGLQLAQTYEAAGKHDEAAAEYEKLGLWEQAREVREKAISLRTTQKVVEVNVNQLIEQMRAGDLMATYKCPTCTAPLTVDKNSTEDTLKFCAYCGAAIQTQDIAEVIAKMVK